MLLAWDIAALLWIMATASTESLKRWVKKRTSLGSPVWAANLCGPPLFKWKITKSDFSFTPRMFGRWGSCLQGIFLFSQSMLSLCKGDNLFNYNYFIYICNLQCPHAPCLATFLTSLCSTVCFEFALKIWLKAAAITMLYLSQEDGPCQSSAMLASWF